MAIAPIARLEREPPLIPRRDKVHMADATGGIARSVQVGDTLAQVASRMGVGAGLTLDIATYNVDLDELRRAQPGDRVIGFVDVDHAVDGGEPLVLPPYPLIGLGSRHSPTGKSVDAVVEPPISAASLLRSVRATPAAAAVAAQVLRGIGSLSPQNGLVMESIAYGMLQAGAEHRAWLDRRSEVVDPDLERLVRFERNGSQLRVVLDRPLARNAIDRTMRDSLFEAFTLAALDNDISVDSH